MDMKHFNFEHLPEKLQKVSKSFHTLAHMVNSGLSNSEEKEMCLRKLLEAKDCAVRAAL